jgi:hypothetical protein
MNPYIIRVFTLSADGDGSPTPTYDDLPEEVRDKINEHTAAKFVVELLNHHDSNIANGQVTVPRLDRFEFELKSRKRRPDKEFTADYAVEGSPEISVTYSLVLDPAYRESDVYKNMNEQVKRKFDEKEAQHTKFNTHHWLHINNVCVKSKIGWDKQQKVFWFLRNDPMDFTKQHKVIGDNPNLTSRMQADYIDDEIIRQVSELLLKEFKMKLVFM